MLCKILGNATELRHHLHHPMLPPVPQSRSPHLIGAVACAWRIAAPKTGNWSLKLPTSDPSLQWGTGPWFHHPSDDDSAVADRPANACSRDFSASAKPFQVLSSRFLITDITASKRPLIITEYLLVRYPSITTYWLIGSGYDVPLEDDRPSRSNFC